MLVTFRMAVNRLYAGVWLSFTDKMFEECSWFLKDGILMFQWYGKIRKSSRRIGAGDDANRYEQLT